tara:strand:- start:1084 stop:1791 length:708 start_codon:yes stop_codon:yes gene_type:complete
MEIPYVHTDVRGIDPVQTAREICQDANKIVVFSGSGLSAESGIPTYRDDQDGFWKQFDAETFASREGFKREPAKVINQYKEWRKALQGFEPNKGHYAIASNDRVTHVTQNVDDLAERAGGTNVLHLHGSMLKDRMDEELGIARPDVVWYGEGLPIDTFAASAEAIEEADVVISVGASGEVMPAASLLHQSLLSSDTQTILVNPNPVAHMGSFDIVLHDLAANVLPVILAPQEVVA